MHCTADTFADYLAKCPTEIQVYAQLQPLSSYTWIITDKFNNKYSDVFITDSVGFWAIPVADLPAGLLTQYGGDYTLEVQGANCKPVKFKVASEYDRICFTLRGGTFEKTALGCDFTCQGISGATSTIITYGINDTEKVITYSPEMLASYGNAPMVQVYALVTGETDQYEIISVPVSQNFTDDVLTSITVANLPGVPGYIIVN